jgi:hypothetical protein
VPNVPPILSFFGLITVILLNLFQKSLWNFDRKVW